MTGALGRVEELSEILVLLFLSSSEVQLGDLTPPQQCELPGWWGGPGVRGSEGAL